MKEKRITPLTHPEVLPAKRSKTRKPKPKTASEIEIGSKTLRAPQDPQDDVEIEDENQETPEPTDSDVEEEAKDLLSSRGQNQDDPSHLPSILEKETSSKSATSTFDPLRRYLEEIRRYPLLSAEEELDLVMKLKNEGDLSAAKALVSANLRLVVKIAFEYRNYYSNLLDLIQEGNFGLMKAVSKFDPSKGARLGYYGSWWIRSYILKYLLDNFRLVRVGTTQAQKKLFYHLMREKERLEAQGLLAGPKLLAEKLNVREKDVIEMEQRLSGRGAEMSLDAPMDAGDGNTTTHLEFLTDDHELPDAALVRNQLLHVLHERLPEFQKTLNDKEQRILNDRILSDEPKTLQEVADHYGLTRERARQIEARVIEKLREFLDL